MGNKRPHQTREWSVNGADSNPSATRRSETGRRFLGRTLQNVEDYMVVVLIEWDRVVFSAKRKLVGRTRRTMRPVSANNGGLIEYQVSL